VAKTAPSNLAATTVAGPQVNLAWGVAGIAGETGYSIQRRDTTADGTFAEVHTVGADTGTWVGDVGPFTAKHRYAYRVLVVGGESDGEMSNEAAVFGGPSHTGRLRRARN
jgi:hypothetical protein